MDPLLAERSKEGELAMASAKQIRHLLLKNLATLLADTDDSAKRALKLYAQALLLDDGDAVVWNRMGTLVSMHLCLSGTLAGIGGIGKESHSNFTLS